MPGNLPTPPLSVISSWPAPNYIDPVQRTWMLPYAIVLGSVVTVLVALRLLLRLRHEGGGLGLDDALLVPSWMILIGVYVTAVYANKNKMAGIHIWDSTFDKLRDEALNAWIGAFLFISGTCCLKVSVLLFYRRIQSSVYNKKWFYAIWVAIIFTISYTLAMVLALIFNCSPTQAYWLSFDQKWSQEHDFKCASTGILNLVAGILSIVTDVYSIALPCIVAQGLQIPLRQKIILNVMFGISSLTIGAAIARTYLYYRMSYHYDFTWLAFDVYFWTMLEFALGIICACAPACRVLFKKYLGDRLTSGRGSSGFRSTGKRQRSESTGELTPHRMENSTTSSGIVRKTTFNVSSNKEEEREEEHEMQRRPPPLDFSQANKSFVETSGPETFYSDSSSESGRKNSGPRSPAEYEEQEMERLKEGRQTFFTVMARSRQPSQSSVVQAMV